MARKSARAAKCCGEIVPRAWRVGDRVRVLRSLSVLPHHVGEAGVVVEVSQYADLYNDGRGKVICVELDGGTGRWWFGSAELGPEYGGVAW